MSSAASEYVPRYTVEDYSTWPGDWELWRGVPVSMSPAPTPRHQLTAFNLATLLRNAIASVDHCGSTALYETDWRINSETVVRPDISVICGDLPEKHISDAPSVIAEVLSPATAGKDLTAKRALYAEQGVSVYLIVDPDQRTLTALTLCDGEYAEISTQKNGDVEIQWAESCFAMIALAEVFQGVG